MIWLIRSVVKTWILDHWKIYGDDDVCVTFTVWKITRKDFPKLGDDDDDNEIAAVEILQPD